MVAAGLPEVRLGDREVRETLSLSCHVFQVSKSPCPRIINLCTLVPALGQSHRGLMVIFPSTKIFLSAARLLTSAHPFLSILPSPSRVRIVRRRKAELVTVGVQHVEKAVCCCCVRACACHGNGSCSVWRDGLHRYIQTDSTHETVLPTARPWGQVHSRPAARETCAAHQRRRRRRHTDPSHSIRLPSRTGRQQRRD